MHTIGSTAFDLNKLMVCIVWLLGLQVDGDEKWLNKIIVLSGLTVHTKDKNI